MTDITLYDFDHNAQVNLLLHGIADESTVFISEAAAIEAAELMDFDDAEVAVAFYDSILADMDKWEAMDMDAIRAGEDAYDDWCDRQDSCYQPVHTYPATTTPYFYDEDGNEHWDFTRQVEYDFGGDEGDDYGQETGERSAAEISERWERNHQAHQAALMAQPIMVQARVMAENMRLSAKSAKEYEAYTRTPQYNDIPF